MKHFRYLTNYREKIPPKKNEIQEMNKKTYVTEM